MAKKNKKNSIFDITDQFKVPDNQAFFNIFLQYQKERNAFFKKIKGVENYFKKYKNILLKDSRPQKAIINLKNCTWFFYAPKTPFKLKTALEGLILIFLLDEMADNNTLPVPYRKNFLEEFDAFIQNISFETKIIATDARQREMQEVWLQHFQRIYCHKDAKKEKWIKAVRDFIQGMLNELDNKKFKTLEEYLANAAPSSGAIFYWQSMITDARCDGQNNETYDKLTQQIALILRLTNDFAQTKEDKNKTTALDFCSNKDELKNIIESELRKFQTLLKRSAAIDKNIRVAMWRSVVFLYYFYQERNF